MFASPQPYFEKPLVDLGSELGKAYRGIFAPEGFIARDKVGVGRQFKTEAERYHAKSFDPDLSKRQLAPQIALITNLPSNPIVLDVGSGTGNTTIPLFDLLPNSVIVATDISEDILAIFSREIVSRQLDTTRLAIACADLHDIQLVPKKFDLVVGGSILHHLIDPSIALDNIGRGLKGGGHAIFVEPFEYAWSVVKLAWQTILSDRRASELGESEHNLFSSFVWQWTTRMGTDKTKPVFKQFDDKWLFTRTYIERVAARVGLSVRIVPHGVPNGMVSILTKQTFDNFLGSQGGWSLPNWTTDILSRFDHAFSIEMWKDLFAGAVVIFSKH